MVLIEEGVKVNIQVYVDLLKENILPWASASFPNGYIFTQDGARSHTSKITQQWCKANLKGFLDKDMWLAPVQISTQ